MLTVSFFENRDLESYSRSGQMSLFDKLILGVCLFHPVFLSDVLSDVIGVTSNYNANSALSSSRGSSIKDVHKKGEGVKLNADESGQGGSA